MGACAVSEGRRTLKLNAGRQCTMCREDPRLFGQQQHPSRIPVYGSLGWLMICPIHDRPPMSIRTV